MANKKLDKYLLLKRRVETAQQQVSKAEGALGEVMKQLKKEFGCDTLKEAKKKLKQLEKQKVSSKENRDAAREKFEEDWSDELED